MYSKEPICECGAELDSDESICSVCYKELVCAICENELDDCECFNED